MGTDDTVASTAATAAAPAPGGEVIAGRYRIVRWLGGGGMGRVYAAHDEELGELVALKVLHGALSADAIERFRREIKLTRRIQHRNIARMFDIGEHAGATRFLTMELIEGAPLGREAAPLAWPALRALALQLCAGLAAAHATGVVHRDLKPDNVIVERDTGRAVITDFGIARGGGDPGVTQAGMIIGTPRYMAPEQLAGAEVDARCDLFALGVMLFELASGERPWPGDGPIAIAVAQATQPPRPLRAPDLPAAAGALILACLAIDPAARPASAEQLGAAFAAIDEPAAAAVAASPATHPARRVARALAVLPFARAPADDYLADGLRDDLVDTLSTTAGLRVRPAGAAAAADADPREVGRALEVDLVVTGALRRTPAGLRVTARMIGVADGFQIWAHRADVGDADILALADELARAIAAALSTRATPHERPTDPRAVDLYLRARGELRRFWGDHSVAAAALLEEAAAIAPDAPAIIAALALAAVHAWVRRVFDPSLRPRAEAAVARGLATEHGEAYLASAVYRLNRGDVTGGLAHLATALARAPMAAQVHEAVARFLVEVVPGTGAQNEGRRHFEMALGLDPGRAPMLTADLARLDALDGDWPAADRRIATLVGDPDPAVAELGALYQARLAGWRGDLARLAHGMQRMTQIAGDLHALAGIVTSWLATGAFDRAAWHAAVAQLVSPGPPRRIQLAASQRAIEIAMLAGQPDLALDLLTRSLDRGLLDVAWLDRCPVFAPVHHEPAWRAARDELAAHAARALAAFRGG